MTARPLKLRYEGEGQFVPVNAYFATLADKAFVVGEVYAMTEIAERSRASHDHQFAALQGMYDNLPEALAPEYPTFEHFRKYGLIKCGFCTQRRWALANNREAINLAAALRSYDEFTVIQVDGNVVIEWRAESQRMRKAGGMDKARFQASKQALLEWASQIVGVSVEEARKHAGMAA